MLRDARGGNASVEHGSESAGHPYVLYKSSTTTQPSSKILPIAIPDPSKSDDAEFFAGHDAISYPMLGIVVL